MDNGSGAGGMTLIVKTVSRLTFALILVYGLYVSFHGHLSPGGGFAGGVILALAFANLLIAFGREVTLKRLSQPVASFFEGAGGILFLALAVFGFVGGSLFINFLGKGEPFGLISAGVIPVYNVAVVALKEGAGLFSVLVALILMRVDKEEST
ncbi:MAG: MnhB domain-containing protein [Planctomycetota bacterium]